jgi:quercetin dioxygenase-like cupin family protein
MKRPRILYAIVSIIGISSCQQIKNGNEKIMPDQQAEAVFPKGNKINSKNFSGTAWVHMIINNDSTLHVKMGNVTFEPGAKTNWHSHPGGQILIITTGVGYYQEKGGAVQLLRKGDFVEIPPNMAHWHGAVPDSELSHIAISLNTDKGDAVWLRPVTDEEYSRFKN